MKIVILLAAISIIALLPTAPVTSESGDLSMRGGDRIVSVGDSAADVVAKCGEPAWKDKWEEVIREQPDDDTARKVYLTVEDWTYNFGPNQFLHIFTFRNGKVTDMRTGGYGYEVKPDEEKR
jgi:hypothetical protein